MPPKHCAHDGCETLVYQDFRHADYDAHDPARSAVYCGPHCPDPACTAAAHMSFRAAVAAQIAAAAGGGGGAGGDDDAGDGDGGGGAGGGGGGAGGGGGDVSGFQSIATAIAQGFAQASAASRDSAAAARGHSSDDLRKDLGLLTDKELREHPTSFDTARVVELLDSLKGESESIANTRQIIREETSGAKGASAAASSKSHSDAAAQETARLMSEVQKDEPVTTLVLSTSLDEYTPSTSRRVTAGLVGAMKVLHDRDGDKDPDDAGDADNPAPIVIPLDRLREGDAGHELAFVPVSESLGHLFERVGRSHFLAITKSLAVLFSKDVTKFVIRDDKAGANKAVCFVTYRTRLLLVGYREWLRSRPHNWSPDLLTDMLQGPHPPLPISDKPVVVDMLRLFVVMGLLVLVTQADRQKTVVRGSLTALETSIRAGYETWKARYVTTRSNQDNFNKLSATAAGAAAAAAAVPSNPRGGGGGGGGGNPKQGKQFRVRGGAGAGAASAATAAIASGAGAASLLAMAPTNLTATPTAAATGTLLGRRGGATNPANTPSANMVSRPAPGQKPTTYAKCHWTDRTSGTPCGATPPSGKPSTHPLCVKHRREYDSLTDTDRTAIVTKMKTAGVPGVG